MSSIPAHKTAECLAFEAVISPAGGEGAGSQPFHAVLRSGDIGVLRVPGHREGMMVVDLALGLLPPASGQVRFVGRSWHRLTPLEASTARRRLGWISPRPNWLSNLDLDENILLVSRYHGDGSEAALQARMDDLAERFDLSGIPRTRGPFADEKTRRRCGWVRALMPRPKVVLVGAGMADNAGEMRLLAQVLTSEPERPQALLWIASDGEAEAVRTVLAPSQSLSWDPGGSTGNE